MKDRSLFEKLLGIIERLDANDEIGTFVPIRFIQLREGARNFFRLYDTNNLMPDFSVSLRVIRNVLGSTIRLLIFTQCSANTRL